MKRRHTGWLLITIGLCLLIGLQPARASSLLVASPVLTISAAPWPLVINQGARLTVTASNPSPENADNVVVTAGVPNNMALSNVSATQGEINVFNSAVTVHVGTLGAGQTVQVLLDVVVVAAYPTDAPFNLCAGLTFAGGTARLSCLPNQPAGSTPGRPPVTLAPNGQRPIYDPNRPPTYLPVSGAPIDLLASITLIAGTVSLAVGLLRRKVR
jgi:uncharacterized repeat protein (TIGR01451 family)